MWGTQFHPRSSPDEKEKKDKIDNEKIDNGEKIEHQKDTKYKASDIL